MVLQSVVIAGGSGFVGSRLATTLVNAGASVTVLTRDVARANIPNGVQARAWSAKPGAASEWSDVLRRADLVVCLAGESIVSRWDGSGRERIVNSRLDSSSAIVEAVNTLPVEERPQCFIGASAVGYYGFDMGDRIVEEKDQPGSDFLAKLCVAWEKAGEQAMTEVEGVRAASVRLGVVLGAGGGALSKMIPAFQFFAGGPLGSGSQWVPWVHVDDVVRAIIKIGEDESLSGAFNVTAPNAVSMKEWAASVGRALNRPSLFPVPSIVLKVALGEASCVVLEGQRVAPTRLVNSGFKFEYETVDEAMRAVASEL